MDDPPSWAADRGFHAACEEVKPERGWFVYPGRERYPLGERLEAIGLRDLAEQIKGLTKPGGR